MATDDNSENGNNDAKARRVPTGPGRRAKSSSPGRNENTSRPGVGAALRGVVDSALLSKLEGDLAAGGPIDLADLDRSMELGNAGLRDYLNLYYELLSRLSPAELLDADLDLPSEAKLAAALEGLADLGESNLSSAMFGVAELLGTLQEKIDRLSVKLRGRGE